MSEGLPVMNQQQQQQQATGGGQAGAGGPRGAGGRGGPGKGRRAPPRDGGRARESKGSSSRGGGGSNAQQGSQEEQRGGRKNGKKGRGVDVSDLANFRLYRPPPSSLDHRSTRKHTTHYAKEDYIHVSCQFVIRESFTSTSDLTLIDQFAGWEDVEQVRGWAEPAACPICLYPPTAPMSPVCGHAMCYACALRFADNCPGGDCPICTKPLIMAEFRPLRAVPRRPHAVGDEVEFKLVSRRKTGRVVVPATGGEDTTTLPNVSSEWGTLFSSVLTASPSQLLEEVFLPQERELRGQLDSGDEELTPYILRALEQVEERKGACLTEEQGPRRLARNEEGEESGSGPVVHFYQAADGQSLFIHPVITRCIIHECGSIAAAFPTLTATLTSLEHHSQSPELRSRYRYFSHLPLGAALSFAEFDVRPLVSEETFTQFKESIERRRSERSAKERRERAYTARLSAAAAEKEVSYRCSEYLPAYSEVSGAATTQHLYKSRETYNDVISSTSPPSVPSSFAEKLRAGASSSSPWVRLHGNPAPSERGRMNSCSSDVSGDGAVAPSYQASFSASLNDAFASLGHHDNQAPPPVQGGNTGQQQGGKKKKKKGKTISLTGGARRG